MAELAVARGLTRHYAVGSGLVRGRGVVRALEDVSFEVREGEILGVVGESGCGKSTLGRCLLRLEVPTAGAVSVAGMDLAALRGRREVLALRRAAQMIFQDPYGSLNPRLRVGSIVGEGLAIHGIGGRSERPERVGALLRQVGLAPDDARKFPHELSGGQRQRVAIARALSVGPRFVVADEPVSALDPSVQAQVVNLLLDLQEQHGLTYLLVSHDLGLVGRIADRVLVLYLGRIVEQGVAAEVLAAPLHPYARALVDAAPVGDPALRRARVVVEGEPPSPLDPPPGCAYHPRCPLVIGRCREERPPLRGTDRQVACWVTGG
ncbi:MAG: ABC transporter ATP-binding protein [Myxococcales bacterium]